MECMDYKAQFYMVLYEHKEQQSPTATAMNIQHTLTHVQPSFDLLSISLYISYIQTQYTVYRKNHTRCKMQIHTRLHGWKIFSSFFIFLLWVESFPNDWNCNMRAYAFHTFFQMEIEIQGKHFCSIANAYTYVVCPVCFVVYTSKNNKKQHQNKNKNFREKAFKSYHTYSTNIMYITYGFKWFRNG